MARRSRRGTTGEARTNVRPSGQDRRLSRLAVIAVVVLVALTLIGGATSGARPGGSTPSPSPTSLGQLFP